MDETYRVIIENEAEEKIEDIVKYLVQNASLSAAENVRVGLFKAMNGLRKIPHSHGLLRYVNSQKTYRRIKKWSYLIIFYIKEEEKEVIVVDVAHSSQNPQRLIDKFSD